MEQTRTVNDIHSELCNRNLKELKDMVGKEVESVYEAEIKEVYDPTYKIIVFKDKSFAIFNIREYGGLVRFDYVSEFIDNYGNEKRLHKDLFESGIMKKSDYLLIQAYKEEQKEKIKKENEKEDIKLTKERLEKLTNKKIVLK